MKKICLGIIGAGNMSQAIIKSIAGGKLDKYLENEKAELNIIVSDSNDDQLEKVRALNSEFISTALNNDELAGKCDYILFAVKPQNFEEAAEKINLKNKVIISIMAGVPIEKIVKISGSNKVVRVMPNLNAKIGESVNTYAALNLDTREEGFIAALLASFGANVKTSESNINAATGVAGSGPAFVFMFIKAFKDAAQSYGFSETEAKLLAVKTISGSAGLIASSDTDIDILIDSVCSKGGTTIEGVNYLRANNFENIVKTAIDKAVKRAEELGRN